MLEKCTERETALAPFHLKQIRYHFSSREQLDWVSNHILYPEQGEVKYVAHKAMLTWI